MLLVYCHFLDVFLPLSHTLLLRRFLQGWVGLMVTLQPFYIGGLEDPEDAKISAFGAMGMFLVTLVLSLVGIFYDNNFGKSSETVATTEIEAEGYVLNTGDAADYGTKY